MTWFASWFDSPYYHRLYQHRDDTEAQAFIRRLLDYLQFPTGARVLDMACGRGRHSVQLAQLGYSVLGVDLSPESIAFANARHQSPTLSFSEWDMRQPFQQELGNFDLILNLFTSFGYFENEEEHRQTLQNMADALRDENSRLVIDFFNAHRSIQQLVLSEEKAVDGLVFQLERYVKNGYICKDIRFEDQGQRYAFQERVRAFLLDDFSRLLESVGLRLFHTFGNYQLDPFDVSTSERLILIAGR